MYIDSDLSLCAVSDNVLTAQSETTQATFVSDNVVDLTHIPRNVIENLYFVFQCEVQPISTSGTFQIDLVTSAATGLTTPQTLWSTGIISNAICTAWVAQSTIYAFKVPANMLLRYLGANYTIATANFTGGSWRAFFTPDAPYLIAATP